MAWAAQADFKILAYKDLPGSSLDDFATAPRRCFGSYKAATNHLQTCQAVAIPRLAPSQLQEYIASQFRDFGIDTSRYSSWWGLDPPKLTFYNRTVVDIHAADPDTAPEETNVPRRTATMDNSSASDVSSLDTQSQVDKENRRCHDLRQRTLRHVSDKAIYKLPNSKENFLQWEQLTKVELLQDAWCVDGLSIMRHLHTTTTNRQFSADFCNYLQHCALQGGELVKSEVLSGDAKALIVQVYGCELYRHLLNVYNPLVPNGYGNITTSAKQIWAIQRRWIATHHLFLSIPV
jgi:hypothetical protein